MSSFTHSLILEDTGDGHNWRVHRGFRYYISDSLTGWYIPVDEGFLTDLASIPRLARVIVSVNGKGNNAAVVHDVLYRRPVIFKDDPATYGRCMQRISRLRADRIFHDALRVAGASKLRTRTLYRGVRLGGWVTWHRYRRRERGL